MRVNEEIHVSRIINGKEIASDVIARVKTSTADLVARTGVTPGIAVVIVGEDPASQVYVRSKGKMAEECGFKSLTHRLAADTGEDKLLALWPNSMPMHRSTAFSCNCRCPKHIDEGKIIQAISPEKDVDGFHFINVGKLGTGETASAFVPCTPAGSMLLIEKALGTRDLSGLTAVVVGRSNIVGKPMANLLLLANATVTIAHSRTKDLPALARTADILVAAVGRPEMIKADWVKPGACVIDVGINRVASATPGASGTRLVGDVDFEACQPVAGSITPVPGGVGPMTIAMLMANTLSGACRAAGIEPPAY